MDWSKKIYPTITTPPNYSWQYKIWECDRLGIDTVSVFPEFVKIKERKRLYEAIEKSRIRYIPHVHIRDDFEKWELDFFFKKYKTRHFNFHEHSFDDLWKWPGYAKYIYLEYNKDNFISDMVQVKKIAGLCIDLSHLWSAKYLKAKEFSKTNKDLKKYKVGCNHINGYSYRLKRDLHTIRSYQQLDYLKEVPKKYFSQVISLEMNNSIVEQLKYKKYIVKILNRK